MVVGRPSSVDYGEHDHGHDGRSQSYGKQLTPHKVGSQVLPRGKMDANVDRHSDVIGNFYPGGRNELPHDYNDADFHLNVSAPQHPPLVLSVSRVRTRSRFSLVGA